MAQFVEALRNAARRAYCSQVRQSPQWFSNLREVVLPGDLVRRGDALNKWICGPDADTDSPPLPFEGGQCAGVSYQVFLTRN